MDAGEFLACRPAEARRLLKAITLRHDRREEFAGLVSFRKRKDQVQKIPVKNRVVKFLVFGISSATLSTLLFSVNHKFLFRFKTTN